MTKLVLILKALRIIFIYVQEVFREGLLPRLGNYDKPTTDQPINCRRRTRGFMRAEVTIPIIT